MNRVYLFGTVVFKSKLKYVISPKLKVYMEIVIETISGDKFNCIVGENLIELMEEIKMLDYIYINGFGVIETELLKVICNEIYSFK